MGTVKRYTSASKREEGWEARDSWTDANGKRRQERKKWPRTEARNLKQCEAEAKAWIAKRQAARAKGEVFQMSREPLGSLIDRWLKTLSSPRSENTIAQYESAARCRFDTVRHIPVSEFTTAMARRLVDGWTDQGLSPASVQKGFVVLRGAIRLAIEERGLIESPLVEVKRPPVEDPPIDTWSPKQVEEFLRGTRAHRWGFAFELLFASLLRIGEVTALRWEDIDMTAGLIHVRRTWSRDKNRKQIIVDRAKTKESDRFVPLPAHVIARLARVRAERDWDDGGWVCANRDKPVTPGGLSKQWTTAVEKSGLPELTPHGARHTGATNLIAAGVTASDVQHILGHTDPTFTLKRYVHPKQDGLMSAITTLGALYQGELTLSRAQVAPKVVPMLPRGGERDGGRQEVGT